MEPGMLAGLAALLHTSEPALRLLVSILIGYPLGIFHRYALYGKNASLQHLFFAVCGICIGYYNYSWAVLHSVSSVLVGYLILATMGGTRHSVVVSFIFNMGYLIIGYYYTGTDTYDIKWSMPHCVLTLRLIGLTVDVYDGTKPPERLSKDQKETALDRTPNLLEVAAHTYFPASFLVGPQFPMKRYLGMITGELRPKRDEMPQCVVPGLLRCLSGFLYLGLYQVGNSYFYDFYLLSPQYKALPFWQRAFAMGIWGKLVMYKYISCWLIAEGVCITTGLTYNGTDQKGNIRWDGCANVKLRVYEGATKFGHFIASFNINTNNWVAHYIYKRLRFMGNRYISQGTTLLFLALWHGLHSGYYACFFLEFIIMKLEKDVETIFAMRPGLQNFVDRPGVKQVMWVLRKIYLIVFMGYCMTPFVLLSAHKWTEVFSSVYWMGHVFFTPWLLFGHLVVKACRPPRQHAE